MIKKYFASILIFAMAGSLMAGTPSRFFNVDMTTEQEGEPTQVKLRIPIAMASALAPQIQEALDSIEANETNNLRELWNQIRKVGPNRYAEIHSKDADVTVDTDREHLLVAIDSEEQGRLDIKVRLELGDLLFSASATQAETLIKAASNMTGRDLVSIKGDKLNGRIWID
jgi:hypothetical protein